MKNFVLDLEDLEIYIESDYFLCAWNISVHNTSQEHQLACSLAIQGGFSPKLLLYFAGCIAILINGILLITNIRSSKFTSAGMISLNNLYVVNVLMGVSELMMVSKDDVFVIGTVAEPRGGKHVGVY